MFVKDVMQNDAVCVDRDQPASEVAKLLLSLGISGAPVTHDGRVVGVVSLRDLVRHGGSLATTHTPREPRPWYFREVCAEPDADLEQMVDFTHAVPVKEVMSTTVYAVDESDSLASAVQMMLRANIHRVIVDCATGAPGILTTTDVMRALPGLLERRR